MCVVGGVITCIEAYEAILCPCCIAGQLGLPAEDFFVDVAPRFSGAVALEWLPSDDQLLTAFHKSGYRSPGAAGSIPAPVSFLRIWLPHTAP